MSLKLFVLLLLPVLGYSIERFSCRGRILGGYYADASSGCRAFHVCVRVAGGGVRDFRFRCPPGTLFHREAQTCADWGDDAGDVGCPDELDDGQFDLYRIGSGFESKKSTYSAPPPLPEDEPEFALQRAETGDRRLHQNKQQSQSSNDLRASHSSDFFSGRRDRGRDDTPAPVAPSSTYAPVTRGNYRRPSQRTHSPTTTTTQAPFTTQQPTVEPYKRKLIRKRPVYNASQFSTSASSFTSSQPPVTPAYADTNAKYSESSQQSSSQNNAHYNSFNGNTVTPNIYKHDPVQSFNPVTSKIQHSHAPVPAPAPANDVALTDSFNKQPNHKNSNYYSTSTGSTDNNYNNANRQPSTNNNNYNNNYDANQKYYDTNEYNKIKATVHNSYNVASVETENVNHNNVNSNKANLNGANTNNHKNSDTANYNNYDNANLNNNNVNYNSANYNNNNYNDANYNNGKSNNVNYNNGNSNNVNYNNVNKNNANYNNADNTNNANYNQVKKVASNNPGNNHGNSPAYNVNKVEVSPNGNQYPGSTPGYVAQKQSTPGYTSVPKKVPSSSAYSSPSPGSAYTTPRIPSPTPNVNTVAYNTNTALDARAPTFTADNEEDDGQYRLPSGEDDGQYRPELYERELLSGAHSLNIAASGNRLPEDQRPRTKPHKHVTPSPTVHSVPPAGPPAPRPFSLSSTPKPVRYQQSASAAPQFIPAVTQNQQSFTVVPVSVPHAQTQRPVAVTYAPTQRPVAVTFAQTQRPVAVTHIPSTTYTAPKQSYSNPQGFLPKTTASSSAPHKPQTPHKVKSDEGKKLSSLSKPIKNTKEDTSYDYAYYDSSDPYSEYENIEEFGKTHVKH